MLSISVVIPALNEEGIIRSLLVYLRELDSNLEIVVSDGGSADSTVEEARPLSKIVHAPRGRGAQMNAGARTASGDILWFLHADTKPHPESIRSMQKVFSDDSVIGGGFRYSLEHPGFQFRLAETLSNMKNRAFKLLFGDMGIFVRRDVFEAMGGYLEIPLMEDMDFCHRLRRLGKIVILPQTIQTSARRWIEEGYVKHSIRSWTFQSAWILGVSPYVLAKGYRFK